MACLHEKELWDNRWCPVTCFYCTGDQKRLCKYNKATNADRIRAMSDEKLADWLARTQVANVAEALEVAKIPYEQEDGLKDKVAKECLDWLKSYAEKEGE